MDQYKIGSRVYIVKDVDGNDIAVPYCPCDNFAFRIWNKTSHRDMVQVFFPTLGGLAPYATEKDWVYHARGGGTPSRDDIPTEWGSPRIHTAYWVCHHTHSQTDS